MAGFLSRLFASDGGGSSARDPSDDFWFTQVGNQTIAGEQVTLSRALGLPIVYDCLAVLSETIGTLPFAVFERRGDARAKSGNHPLMEVFRRPNQEMTTVEFITQMAFDLASSGNFFALVEPSEIGPIGMFWRLDPAHVMVERLTDGSRRYTYSEPGRQRKVYLEDRIWHIRDLPLRDNLVGSSRIECGREAIGAALAAQRYASDFFRNDQTPPFLIMMPSRFGDDESRKNYVRAIQVWWSGKNRHKPGVLDGAEKITTVGSTNRDSQMVESRREMAYEITRLWRIPPHKVGLMDRSTNNNIEHQALEFVIDTLRPWLELIESSVNHFLITSRSKYFFEFNVAGLLRGDLQTRYEAYAKARQWGWISVNEIRALENMNPIANGDVHLQPMNMEPAGQPAQASLFGPKGELVSLQKAGVWVRTPPSLDATAALKIAA